MKIPKFLTQTEFDQTTSTMRTSARTQAIAHAVLVKRYTVRAVALQYGISYQRAWQLAQRIYQNYMDMQQMPEDWKIIKIALPERYIKQVRKLANDLRTKALVSLMKRRPKLNTNLVDNSR